jgi:hypothetical protein
MGWMCLDSHRECLIRQLHILKYNSSLIIDCIGTCKSSYKTSENANVCIGEEKPRQL